MIGKRYYTNTTDGHNKDYLIEYDTERCFVTTTWGPIGGTKQVDRYKADSEEHTMLIVEEKHTRRLKHGYTISDISIDTYASDFASDLNDMIEAERLASR